MLRIAALLSLSGCSILFVSAPGSAGARDAGTCHRSYVAPIIDTVAAVAIAGVAGYAAVKGGDSGNAVTGVGVIVDIVAIASAGNGYQAIEQCRSAK